jgi:hypothetical protein
VYRGRPGLPSRRTTFGSRGSPILTATGTPSWEASSPAQNVDVGNISSAHWDGSEWRVTYSSFDADSAWPGSGAGAYLAMRTGAAHGRSLTSLTKYDQDPLLAPMPDETGAGGVVTAHTYVHTFNVYDWTANACKAYYRDSSVRDADRAQQNADASGRVRRLVHATNTHAHWHQPSTSGGWANDGVVTFPCPTLVNVFEPKAWIEGATAYVSFGVYNSIPDKARPLRGTKTGTTTVGSLTPILVDLSDTVPVTTSAEGDLFFVNLGQACKTTDGVWHTPCYLQRHTSHPNGSYYYDIWMMESLDGLIYAPAYPLVLRDAGVTGEELGAVPLGFADGGNLLVGRISRYFAADSPYYASDTASHGVCINDV